MAISRLWTSGDNHGLWLTVRSINSALCQLQNVMTDLSMYKKQVLISISSCVFFFFSMSKIMLLDGLWVSSYFLYLLETEKEVFYRIYGWKISVTEPMAVSVFVCVSLVSWSTCILFFFILKVLVKYCAMLCIYDLHYYFSQKS